MYVLLKYIKSEAFSKLNDIKVIKHTLSSRNNPKAEIWVLQVLTKTIQFCKFLNFSNGICHNTHNSQYY